jgi:hypothetical protein
MVIFFYIFLKRRSKKYKTLGHVIIAVGNIDRVKH